MTLTEDERRERTLEIVFGSGESSSPAQRARESERVFVRGLDLLTLDTSPRATGRRLTAHEAYEAYGIPKLYQVLAEGSAVISESPDAAGRVLRDRRQQLGLSVRAVAAKSGLAPEVIEALEHSARRPVREYERAARALGLDERKISYRSTPEGNERLTVRLRTLADERPSMPAGTVAALAEAAWVAMTQIRLEDQLGLSQSRPLIRTSDDYGAPGRPPYEVGYDLAHELRDLLGLGLDPIPSMRQLAEDTLKIPIIQTQLHEKVAGATVASANRRAIVLNISGLNSDALVRRSTVAHEIGHLLFDSSTELDELRVDEYEDLAQRPDTRPDPVEQRANAFAVELLAPQSAAVARFREREDLFSDVLDYFGISFTAGRYQVWNGLGRSVPLENLRAANRRPEPDWDARESYTLTYHPIRQLASRPARGGRFSAVVLRAAHERLISWDTAAEWLECSVEDAQPSIDAVAGLFPEVFVNS